ncbi:MAG: hypothetical protein A3H64_01150 [Candidatus Ryanbacteria bacterium RIFCSPLOWO2_02_FULL_45_11c]|uniref:DUF378 domain-containing protein n=1 Tax=Candidatus Ryanbacteria bacterium RIFCSPLOWO2_02_FULL_45_11c TaxID=1802128 RepID=A0A1G2GY08_9BACT|nr:MAG: hypothetical protein A3H64_01150 [Candidatus Ryanbacteria bacterium RIFCSPLOWO2_02_FULL_45_11c]
MKALHTVAFILVVIGGLNWLLMGVVGWDIGALLGGMDALISKIIYILVGLSAILLLVTHKKDCRYCSEGSSSIPSSGMGSSSMPR